MNCFNFFIRLLSGGILVLAALFASSAYAICEGRGCDNAYEPDNSIETISITISANGDTDNARWDGNLTPSLLRTAGTIAAFMTSPDSSEQCDPTSNTCNIGGTSENPLSLQCTGPGDQMDCYIPSFGSSDVEPFRMSCSLTDDQQIGAAVQCEVTLNRGAIEASLPAELQGTNFGSLATSFLNCMYGSFGNAASMCSQIMDALSNSDHDYAMQLIMALAPLNPETAGNLTREGIRNGTSTIFNRISQLRTNNTQVSNTSSQLYFANNQFLAAGTQLAANDSLASDATPASVSTNISDFGKLGIFVNLNVTDGKYKDGSLASSSDFTSSMLTLGVDYRVRNDLVTGLAFNIGQSKTDYKSDVNGELSADSYSFIIYNSFYRNNWYFDTSLTIGGDTYNQERNPAVLGNSFEAEYHSMQYNLAATFGYDFIFNAFSIAPFAQITAGRVEIDGYTEKAKNPLAPGVALNMDDQNRDIGMLNVGSHFRYVFTTQHGVFIPVITLSAVNDFQNDAQVVTGRFVGITDNSAAFGIRSEKSDANYFIVGAGFSFQLKNGNAGFINLETLQGYENLDQNRFTFGWRWEI